MPTARKLSLALWIGSCLLVCDAALRADDWPHWLGPNYDGKSAEKGWRKDWGEKGPPRLFEVEIGTGYSALPVVDGRIFVWHREAMQLHLDSLDALTGKRVWRHSAKTSYEDHFGYDNGPRCCPIVHDDRVLLLDPEGVLSAVKRSDGELIWRVPIREKFGIDQNFFGVGASPLLHDGNIYCNLGGKNFIPAGVSDGMAFAFDAKTGEKKWHTKTDGGSYASPTLAEIDGQDHLFVFHRGGVSDLDPASGEERWKFPWHARFQNSVNGATPLVVGDLLFISATYRTGSACLRVHKNGYETVWKDDPETRGFVLDVHWAPPLEVDGHLYAFSGRNPPDAVFKCVELETGKVAWKWRSPFYRGSMLWADGHAIVLGEFGHLGLLKLSPKGHEEIALIPDVLKRYSWTVPTLSGGILYLRDLEKLIAFDLRPQAEASASMSESGD